MNFYFRSQIKNVCFYTYFQKPHRLLPTNLYVILYNFKARHPDELDLKAGYKVSIKIIFPENSKELEKRKQIN